MARRPIPIKIKPKDLTQIGQSDTPRGAGGLMGWAGVALILDIDLKLLEQPSVADEVSIL